jgi:hypothetical protein
MQQEAQELHGVYKQAHLQQQQQRSASMSESHVHACRVGRSRCSVTVVHNSGGVPLVSSCSRLTCSGRHSTQQLRTLLGNFSQVNEENVVAY